MMLLKVSLWPFKEPQSLGFILKPIVESTPWHNNNENVGLWIHNLIFHHCVMEPGDPICNDGYVQINSQSLKLIWINGRFSKAGSTSALWSDSSGNLHSGRRKLNMNAKCHKAKYICTFWWRWFWDVASNLSCEGNQTTISYVQGAVKT